MAHTDLAALAIKILELLNPKKWWDAACAYFRRRQAAKAKADGRVICDDCAYYDVDEGSKKTDGPFCTTCYDGKGKKVRFIRAQRPPECTGSSWKYVMCPECQHVIASKSIGQYLNIQQ
jgi:hypothetical protein